MTTSPGVISDVTFGTSKKFNLGEVFLVWKGGGVKTQEVYNRQFFEKPTNQLIKLPSAAGGWGDGISGGKMLKISGYGFRCGGWTTENQPFSESTKEMMRNDWNHPVENDQGYQTLHLSKLFNGCVLLCLNSLQPYFLKCVWYIIPGWRQQTPQASGFDLMTPDDWWMASHIQNHHVGLQRPLGRI